jgi:hypothetical protein
VPPIGTADTGAGWVICQTMDTNDSSFDDSGYTIHFQRDEATDDTTGADIPEFTQDVPVKP